jgi:hypothetical protein
MTAIEYIKEKSKNIYERLSWEAKHSAVINLVFYPYWWFMDRERGMDFPFYFPNEKRFVERKLAIFIEWVNNFVNLHEPERYAGDTNLTLIQRIKYVSKNFHFYTNDTMSNLYFSERLPLRDYQRVKNYFSNYYLLFLTYNTASGIFLIALNNYLFRTRKASIPLTAVASVTTYMLFSSNYQLSYYMMDKAFSQSVRRLGYSHLIHKYNSHYLRNVDFVSH